MDPERKRHLLAETVDRLLNDQRDEPLRVEHLMTVAPECIHPDTTVLELVRLFHEKQFRHPLVADEQGRLLGVISDRDVIRCFGPGDYPEECLLERITAADIMSTDVISIGPGATVELAVDRMNDYGINCLPVVVGQRLVGIVTSTDLVVMLQVLLPLVGQQSDTESVRAVGEAIDQAFHNADRQLALFF